MNAYAKGQENYALEVLLCLVFLKGYIVSISLIFIDSLLDKILGIFRYMLYKLIYQFCRWDMLD